MYINRISKYSSMIYKVLYYYNETYAARVNLIKLFYTESAIYFHIIIIIYTNLMY